MAKKQTLRSQNPEAEHAPISTAAAQVAVHKSPVLGQGHDYLQILSERLRAGRVVLCAGAALGTRAPAWRGMVERLLDELGRHPGNEAAVSESARLFGAYPLSVCGFIRRRLGDAFPAALSTALKTASTDDAGFATQRNELLKNIGKLPFRAVLTTAFDDALVRTCIDEKPEVRVYTADQSEEVRRDGRGRYILRLLGGSDQPSTLLFSESDLRHTLADESFRNLIGELYNKRSFLFLGFDPADPDFGLVVDRMLVSASRPTGLQAGAEPLHFALLTGVPRVVQEEIEAAYGIHALPTEQFPDERTLLRALCEMLGDHPGEILPDDDDLEGWLRVLQQEPNRSDATAKLAELEERLEEAGDADRLIELWVGRTEVEPSGRGRAHCLRQVAAIFERKKGQMAEAFQALLAASKEAPEFVPLDELERLAGISGLWGELLSALRELLPQFDAKARPELLLRIARLYGEKLNHLEYALTSLGEAQKLDISDAATRLKMLEMRVELTRRAERWKDLAEAIGQLAAALSEDEGERKIDLYLEQGDLYESRLSDSVSAIAAFKKARAHGPVSRDALQALEHSLRRHSNWVELVALLDDKAALCEKNGDPQGALAARREAAQLQGEHIDDRKQAALRWEAILALAPNDLETLRALEKLYAGHDAGGGASEKYLSVVSALADNLPFGKEQLALYRRLYAEYEELPGHGAQTESCLKKILALDPTAEDAYRGLERLYQKERRFPELVDTYQRHIAHTQSSKVELWAALGRVHEVDIGGGDPAAMRKEAPAAIAAWRSLLEINPTHLGALEALGRLYQVVEQYQDAMRAMEKRAQLLDDRTQKAALYYEAGRLCEKQQLDLKTTEEHYVRAIEINPQHVQAMTALASLYHGQREYLRAAKLYLEAAENTQNRLDKTRYLVEAARQYLLGDEKPRARALYEQALKLDPEHTDAAAGFVELLWQEQAFEQALPFLEVLARKDEKPALQLERLCRLGQTAKALGLHDKALRAYQRAVALDATNLAALHGLIPLLVQAGQFVDAQKLCAEALLTHANVLSVGERVELLALLGECEQRLEHSAAAAKALRAALSLDPLHQASLRTLLKLPGLDPQEGVDLRQALIKALLSLEASGDGQTPPADTTFERVNLLTEIGDLLFGALSRPQEALEFYKEGLALRPESHLLLHKCLDVYTKEAMWPEAADVLDTLIGNEKNARRRARYLLTAALIARDELSDARRALTLLLAALEDEPTLERAIEALEELAVTLDDPRELVRVYQFKIKALGPEASDSPKQRAERLRLWTALSALCIQRLGDLATGATAYEVTVALDGQNLDRHRQLAAIYTEMGGEQIDKAIAAHHTILARNKAELASYRALKELYIRSFQREKAAAVAYALYLLRKEDPADLSLVEEMKARPLRPATRTLSKELWRLLAHPDEDARLGALFQTLRDVAMASHAHAWKDHGISRKDRLGLAGNAFYEKALRYGFEALDSPMPEVYAQPDDPELGERSYRLVIAMDKEAKEKGTMALPIPCLLLGKGLLSAQRPEREVIYEIGRLAALLRPERAVRTVYSTAAQLGLIIDAALFLGGAEAGAAPKVIETAQGLSRALPPAALEQVRRIGAALRETEVQSEAAAHAWLGSSDLTAVRAGLVLSGDLETVALLLATDPPGMTPLSPKQRLLDIIHFTVTEEYFTIRQHLGLMA